MKPTGTTTHLDQHSVSDLAEALERQVEAQAETAKRAIGEYKKTILHETASGGLRQSETQREVERAVNQYMQSRRRLDELRAQMSARELPTSELTVI
jgi:hypothetical protein